MKTVSHILVATDFSPCASAAVQRAAQLAVVHCASLCLLHARDVSAWQGLKGLFDAQRLSVDPAPEVRMRQRLEELTAALSKQIQLPVGSEFGVGAVHTVIGDHARANPDTLVVIGSRFDPALEGLGSTALKVVRSPACAVLIDRTDGIRPYEKVLSAVDMRAGSMRAASAATATSSSEGHQMNEFPMWVEVLVAAMLVVGGTFLLIGAIGMTRFPDFFMRLHAPTKATTLGVGGVLLASMVISWGSGLAGVHELLITLFLFISAPVSANLMAQAALHLRVPSTATPPDDLPLD